MRRVTYLLSAGFLIVGLSGHLLGDHAELPLVSARSIDVSAAPLLFSSQQASSQPPVAAHETLLRRNCIGCHNQRTRTADLALDTLNLANPGEQAAIWEKVVRKLRAGVMPPAGRPRPDPAATKSFLSWLEGELDSFAATHTDPGEHELFHRLNRTEYQNAIRDLLDLEINASEYLPPDDVSHGFDNIAGTLKLSPMLFERYLSASQKISRLAVGSPPLSPGTDVFRLPGDLSQVDRMDGLPLGTRGGMSVPYVFPLDAEYDIRVELLKNRDGSFYVTEPNELEVSVDGERVALFKVMPPRRRARTADQNADDSEEQDADGKFQVRVPVKAGPRVLTATFVKKTAAADETLRQPFLRVYNASYVRFMVAVGNVSVSGPFNAVSAGDTPSRRRIFTCAPSDAAGEDCARKIVSTLAQRAYRRPGIESDLGELMDVYREGQQARGFEAGIELVLQRILASPNFLFRAEQAAPRVVTNAPSTQAPKVHRVSDLELASRLSFFLWSSIPDDTLIDLAKQGRLSNREVLEQQVRRMLADPRSETLATNFASQWLHLRNLPAARPYERLFPDFDEGLRHALRRETELLFDSVIREDRSAVDLLTADYTFLNERSARHYGISGVYGAHFRRVNLADERRRGLLGQGSIMTVTSQANRTSPVVRGKWILDNILGTPPPPPPANVPPLDEGTKDGKTLSMRERMVQHRANAVCASCHVVMDPLGLALENFDAVGQWRDRSEAGTPIDASGALPDGTTFEGVAGLRGALLDRSDLFVTTLTEKLLTYALGRGLEYYDAPAVRAITRGAAGHDNRISALILGIVNSTPFQMRRTRS
jgi:mono/diheme cytochrome c family protein